MCVYEIFRQLGNNISAPYLNLFAKPETCLVNWLINLLTVQKQAEFIFLLYTVSGFKLKSFITTRISVSEIISH